MSENKHTPEPCATEAGGPGTDCFYIVDSAGNVAIAKVFNYMMQGVGGINASRIVACVNACAGISTDSLGSEGSAVMGWNRAARKLIDISKQRDELLAALEKLAEVYDAMGAPRGPSRIIADEAIAAAKEWKESK